MRQRITASALAISATALIGLAMHEGFAPVATRPVPDDPPTVGFGTTWHADGTPVKLGERITPQRALMLLNHDVSATERALHRCIGDVPLFQHEWDAYVSLAYNVGAGRFCGGSIARALRSDPPDYAAACAAIKLYNRAHGKVLRGLVIRREHESQMCMGGPS